MKKHMDIDGGNAFDWSRSSEGYAKFRDIYPKEFYSKLINLGLCQKGQKVLDLGTGTGVLPRNMYRYGADFTGVDASEGQIEQAKRLSQENGMDIEYLVSAAEDIDFPDGSFDTVLACQCYIYFDPNIVLSKLHKLLKDKGHFCIIWMGWLPDEDRIAAASEKLILKYNPYWTGAGMKRSEQEVPEWSKSLFNIQNSLVYDIKIPFSRVSWHGRIMASRGIGASSLTEEVIKTFEREHIQMLNNFPEAFHILHYVSILNLVKRD